MWEPDSNQAPFRDGLVTTAAWLGIQSTPEYAELDMFSRAWYKLHRRKLRPYRKWISGSPLYNWSRSFEYPWVLKRIREFCSGDRPARVLDAGSGITFFPFFLGQRLRHELYCVDQDAELGTVFDDPDVNTDGVHYECAPLHDLSMFADQSFDLAYCISVLEHIPRTDWSGTIAELHRVLVPGARLLLTLDVCVDGKSDIARSEVDHLLPLLLTGFRLVGAADAAELLKEEGQPQNLASTEWFRGQMPDRLPWHVPLRQRLGFNRRLTPVRPFFASLWCLVLSLERL